MRPDGRNGSGQRLGRGWRSRGAAGRAELAEGAPGEAPGQRVDGARGDATASEGGTVSDAGSDVTMSSDAGRTGDGGGLMLTSTALARDAFPPRIPAPARTRRLPFLGVAARPTPRAYALVLTDTNNNLNHWVVWDLPATVTRFRRP